MSHVLTDVLKAIEQEEDEERGARRAYRRERAAEWGHEQGAQHLAKYRETHPRSRRAPTVRTPRKRVPMPRKNPQPQTEYFIHQSPRFQLLLSLAVESIAADRQVEQVPDPQNWRYKQAAPKDKVRLFRNDGSLIVSRVVAEAVGYWARRFNAAAPNVLEDCRCFWLENELLNFENGSKRRTTHIMLYPDANGQLTDLVNQLSFLPVGKPPPTTVLVMSVCAAAYATGKVPPLCVVPNLSTSNQ